MAAAELLQVADAVVTAVNGQTFDAPYNASLGAVRFFVPVFALTGLDALKVSVVPLRRTSTIADRERQQEMGYEIAVAFQRHLPAPADAATTATMVGDLLRLVEQVNDFLVRQESLSGVNAYVVESSNDPPYDADMLDKDSEFLSAIVLTYRTYR